MEAILEFFSALPNEIYVFVISMLPIVELRGAIPVGAGLGLPFYINYLVSVVGNLLPVPFIIFFISKFLDFLARFRIFRPMINWIRKKANKHSSKVIKEEKPNEGGEEKDGVNESEQVKEQVAAEVAECEPRIEAEQSTAELGESDPSAEQTSVQSAFNQESELMVSAEENLGASEEQTTVQSAEQQEQQTPKKRRMTRAIFAALLLFVAIPIPGTGAWTGGLVAALFDLPKRWSILAIALGVLTSGVIMTLASYGVLGFLNIFL